MRSSCVTSASTTSYADAPRGIGRPKKFFTWLTAISTAAPAVKPTTTVCDTKLTSVPSRSAPSAELDHADQERQRQHQLHVLGAAGDRQRADGGEDDDRDRRRRPRHQVPRRAPQRGDDRRHHRRVEAVLRRHAGDGGERNALRHQHDAAGQPGDRVGAQRAAVDAVAASAGTAAAAEARAPWRRSSTGHPCAFPSEHRGSGFAGPLALPPGGRRRRRFGGVHL